MEEENVIGIALIVSSLNRIEKVIDPVSPNGLKPIVSVNVYTV